MSEQNLEQTTPDAGGNSMKWFSRIALFATIMTAWPVIFGAHTTTTGAGMAFPDWPTSDGQNMITYPWFSGNADQFLEHGHRLGGMTIGILSLVLVVAAWQLDKRKWVLVLTLIVGFGVLAQGIMGGTRVTQNSIGWAIFHGAFAPLVTSLFAVIAVVTGKKWNSISTEVSSINLGRCRGYAHAAVICLYLQYILGCFLRHKGSCVHEHLGFAFLSTVAIILMKVATFRSNSRWLKSSAGLVATFLLIQLLLGLGAWVTRFGLPSVFDYVPVINSTEQNFMRTAHTVTGMMLFVSTVVHLVKARRISWLQKQAASLTSEGGTT